MYFCFVCLFVFTISVLYEQFIVLWKQLPVQLDNRKPFPVLWEEFPVLLDNFEQLRVQWERFPVHLDNFVVVWNFSSAVSRHYSHI